MKSPGSPPAKDPVAAVWRGRGKAGAGAEGAAAHTLA